jgi:hypothetical protein
VPKRQHPLVRAYGRWLLPQRYVRIPDTDLEEAAQPVVTFPALVVISPGRPEMVLDAYGCRDVRPGVYHAVWGLVLRVVVLAELPRTRETLLLRLLGARRLLREAFADLAALPDDAWEKTLAAPLLVHFQLGTGDPAADPSCRRLPSPASRWPTSRTSSAGACACSAPRRSSTCSTMWADPIAAR